MFYAVLSVIVRWHEEHIYEILTHGNRNRLIRNCRRRAEDIYNSEFYELSWIDSEGIENFLVYSPREIRKITWQVFDGVPSADLLDGANN